MCYAIYFLFALPLFFDFSFALFTYFLQNRQKKPQASTHCWVLMGLSACWQFIHISFICWVLFIFIWSLHRRNLLFCIFSVSVLLLFEVSEHAGCWSNGLIWISREFFVWDSLLFWTVFNMFEQWLNTLCAMRMCVWVCDDWRTSPLFVDCIYFGVRNQNPKSRAKFF